MHMEMHVLGETIIILLGFPLRAWCTIRGWLFTVWFIWQIACSKVNKFTICTKRFLILKIIFFLSATRMNGWGIMRIRKRTVHLHDVHVIKNVIISLNLCVVHACIVIVFNFIFIWWIKSNQIQLIKSIMIFLMCLFIGWCKSFHCCLVKRVLKGCK